MRRVIDGKWWVISALISLGPLWLVPRDSWDGVIGSYGLATGDFSGLVPWITNANWYLLDWFYRALGQVCLFTGIPPWIVVKSVISVCVVLIAVEASRFGESVLRLPQEAARWIGPLVLVFPAWANLYSSVFIYLIFIWATLAGHRLLHEPSERLGRVLSLFLAWVLILAGFQINSNLVLVFALEAARWLLRDKQEQWNWRRTALLVCASVAVYAMLRIALSPRGIYAGTYNNLLLPVSRANIIAVVSAIVMYCTWLPLFIPPLAAAYWLRQRQELRSGAQLLSEGRGKSGAACLAALLLVMAAAFPYIAVGKAPILFFYNPFPFLISNNSPVSFTGSRDFLFLADSWSSRHMFVAIGPIALLIAAIAAKLSGVPDARGLKITRVSLLVAWCTLAACLLYTHHLKLKRFALEQSLLNYLAQTELPPPGKVDFEISPFNRRLYGPYESNYWLWLVSGKTVWASAVFHDNEVSRKMTLDQRTGFLKDLPSDPMQHRSHFIMQDYQPGGLCTVMQVTMLLPQNYLAILGAGHRPGLVPVALVNRNSAACG
ncbi:MAG: hypothetical protein V4614_03875 [Pseudomonadota bacterium]